MINLTKRSYTKEFLDRDDVPFADIKLIMKELNTINKYLGGHAITIKGVKALIAGNTFTKPVCICEIGCGGGDNLKAVQLYCLKENIPATFIGIDIKTDCTAFAKQQYPEMNAEWITNDYRLADFGDRKPDIIFSSLFCHHFNEAALTGLLAWMQKNATTGFFINDLQRHPFAYYSIKWITKIFSASYMVKNDGPLSVARGFIKNDWHEIFKSAGIARFSINWKWAFRYLIICKK